MNAQQILQEVTMQDERIAELKETFYPATKEEQANEWLTKLSRGELR